MGKGTQIGVFFDGTGNCKENDVGKGSETNVVKLFELYDNSDSDNFINNQAFYIRGVGSELGEYIIGACLASVDLNVSRRCWLMYRII